MDKTYIIGICGGSGSGKTTIVRQIAEIVSDFVFVPQDMYYKSATYVNNQNITGFNFDHPDAFDTDLLYEQLSALKSGKAVDMPQYDFVHNCRSDNTVHLEPKNIIIYEGIMIYSDKRIRELIDLKIFVDTPSDVRFIRRMKRDIEERGRTVESVTKQYLEVVRPGHIEFIEPTKAFSDLIIPEGGYNQMALKVLTSFIKTNLKQVK